MKSNQILTVNKILKDGLENHKVGKLDKAEVAYRKALKISPNNLIAMKFLGEICQSSNRNKEAIGLFKKVIKNQPDDLETWDNYIKLLMSEKQFENLEIVLKDFSVLFPDNGSAFYNLGLLFYNNQNYFHAIDFCMKSIEINNKNNNISNGICSDNADSWILIGASYFLLKMPTNSLRANKMALMSDPMRHYIMSKIVEAKHYACEWSEYYENNAYLIELVVSGKTIENPFNFLNMTSSGADQLMCAEFNKPSIKVFRDKAIQSLREKIRIGYVSADYYNHATVLLIEKLFILHDRSKFEIFGISINSYTDYVTERIKHLFDEYHDISDLSYKNSADYISKLGIDILVDLKGYTKDQKVEIFSYYPSPIQVSYLGFPGTLGSDFMDYIIADHVLIPPGYEQFYGEKIVRLPGSYQINNNHRDISSIQTLKTDHGLPDSGFVFCCFNNTYKITPQVFDIWMNLLKSIPSSVLWLLSDNDDGVANLKKEAVDRGVSSERLIFAPRMTIDLHLERHHHADLFLDTSPINAHTTTSDALWAGLPVLTCTGEAFASRVAASLLNAVGLSDLITSNYTDYESLAFRLATEPDLLNNYKQHLKLTRSTCDLFNTEKTTRCLESAYIAMHQRRQQGLMPDNIDVTI